MRVAGVEVEGGERVWCDAGALELRPLQEVSVRIAEREAHGRVFITPDQLAGEPPAVTGSVTEILRPYESLDEPDELPGSDMPPLGSEIEVAGGRGWIVALDPVERTVTVRTEDGAEREQPVARASLGGVT